MRGALVALLLIAGGGACFSPAFEDGAIPCGPGGECPSELTCGLEDHRCYASGKVPQACQAGFERKPGSAACVDIDECQTGKDDCADVAACANTPGSFSCACPAAGYTGDGKTCSDIDECMTGAAGCDADATCANSPAGSFTCACKPGFAGPGQTCHADYDVFGIGIEHGCAVRADGALLCWGANARGQLALPEEVEEEHAPRRIGTELWSQVSVGLRTSCGIRRDGTLWCWGENACGVVGNGAMPDLFCNGVVPVREMFQTGGTTARWSSVSVGRSHACAIQTDGSLWCWGQNGGGELGVSGEGNRLTPARVGADAATDKNWDAVAAGGRHTCGLRDGQLWCWGRNDRGQLGDDQTEPSITFPKRIGTSGSWQVLAAAEDHTCGVVVDGTLYCWGAGDDGQLGAGKSGDGVQENAPVAVAPPGSERWVTVAAGGAMTCARTTGGRLSCWGLNTFGELGDGSFVDKNKPAAVGRDTDWDRVAVGLRTACAARTDGRLSCWGKNVQGALGVGTGSSAATPQETGLTGYSIVAHGGSHACGIRAGDRTLWCWGDNSYGQLGIGVAGGARDEPTQVSGAGTYSQVSAGATATCAIKSGGELFCWGYNGSGQLGIDAEGAMADRAVPTRVVDGAKTWTRISIRNAHACGIQTGGGLYCWGSWTLGRLGLGALSADVLTPRRVGDEVWTSVSTGGYHTCGLRGGGLYCWGYDTDGQLGLGHEPPDNDAQPSPIRVGAFLDWTTVSAGSFHTCGLRTPQNQLYCWGYNQYGQVGNGSSGTNADRRTPALITSERWIDVNAGDYTTCGVNSDGNLFCWGNNNGGLVGNGLVGDVVVTPVTIDDSRDWSQVGLMTGAGCALHADGASACWGQNLHGEWGDGTAFYQTPTALVDD